MSGGWTPTVHLTSHRGIKPTYRADMCSFVPGGFDRGHFGAGSMMGTQTFAGVQSGWDAAVQAASDMGKSVAGSCPQAPVQADVTWALRRRANHLRQGATNRLSIFRAMWPLTISPGPSRRLPVGRTPQALHHAGHGHRSGQDVESQRTGDHGGEARLDIQEVGTTTFRPPYTPVTIGALAGRSVRAHLAGGAAHRHARLARSAWRRDDGSRPVETALWFRTHGNTLSDAYKAEMAIVREQVGMADVSTLGKIDVQGPDAAEFLNRVYVNGFAKLPIGKARYGFMLREDGIVMDDGTTSRLSETEFFMTTTTAQAGKVMSHLEFLLQVVWPELRVTVASVSDQWAAMSMLPGRSRATCSGRISGHRFQYRGASRTWGCSTPTSRAHWPASVCASSG
jgi:hypothetical protein